VHLKVTFPLSLQTLRTVYQERGLYRCNPVGYTLHQIHNPAAEGPSEVALFLADPTTCQYDPEACGSRHNQYIGGSPR